jgi:cysteine desulfurase/selenocysteine lyase
MNGKPLIYLDSAATSQKPQAVLDALLGYYREYNANVHRGVYELAERATIAYETAREKVAAFIGARAEELVFTRGTTEAVNLVAQTYGRAHVRAGDEIVVTEMEHHSNLVPWQMLAAEKGAAIRLIPVREDGHLDLAELDGIVGPRTRLVAMTHQSNVLGTINDVRAVAAAARAARAVLFVDAAQSVPHLPVRVADLECDFLAFSGHKMCGPTGIGALWGRYDLLEGMPPFHGGGEMIERVEYERSTYRQPPHRFEAGTPNIADAIGLRAAVDYLSAVGMAEVRAHEESLVRYALAQLREVPGLKILGPTDPATRGGAMAFQLGDFHAHDIAQVLGEEGIAVRAGHHCAQPLHRKLGVASSARASLYLYNTTDEIDALVRGLEKVRAFFGGRGASR